MQYPTYESFVQISISFQPVKHPQTESSRYLIRLLPLPLFFLSLMLPLGAFRHYTCVRVFSSVVFGYDYKCICVLPLPLPLPLTIKMIFNESRWMLKCCVVCRPLFLFWIQFAFCLTVKTSKIKKETEHKLKMWKKT